MGADTVVGVKAIETRYGGYRFRSRLEARWAVFFDALGIKWEYETEGYVLPNGEHYLPDFWLPEWGCFAEVKPRLFTNEEYIKAALLPESCILLDGMPGVRLYHWTLEYGSAQAIDMGLYAYRHHDCCNWGVDLYVSSLEGHVWITADDDLPFDDGAFTAAVTAARSARFEHGENGREAA